ncbi:MAG: LacI family DNA-binding transcriptional regulator [Sphingobacteriales bacterium]|nr:LacI family DNA-binding transcriptional regulator [Sphingobacteriales bacterium]OJW00189.1 MAG: LacI family transcriptional regulator [Sphingobacteriales bacterium 44-61]
MKSKKEITIYDIAEKLAISSATVSRALQDNPVINKQTRKRVQETARKLGYRANTFASNLRKQKTNTIGVIVHELRSNFITSVLAGIEKVTSLTGYDLIIAHSNETVKKESANALNFYHKRVDGLIASLAFDTKDLSHFLPFHEKNIPVVFFDRVQNSPKNTTVVIDNYKCGYQATKHLINQGCNKITLVTANLNRNVYADRHRGYKDALFDHGIKYSEEYVLIKDLSEQGGIEAAHQVMKMDPLPDGAFITNDFSAVVFMRTLKNYGVKVPQDVAVVGFNNDPISKIIEPQLSTINYPGFDMGEIAARSLINHLNGVSNIGNTDVIVIRTELIVRDSSTKIFKSAP